MSMVDPEMRYRTRRRLIYKCLVIMLPLVFVIFPGQPGPSSAGSSSDSIESRLGPKDGVMLTDKNGELLFGHNICKKLIPASTLKILTALAALHHLGPDYRFPTEFYVNDENDLIIKGYGDPLLVSETVEHIAHILNNRLKRVRDIVLDDSYFKRPIDIPGVAADTLQPYNAPNGALCVNFNTVYFKSENGRIVSAEPQTPMLPIALARIREKKLSSGRILLSDKAGDMRLYAGQLFRYFLSQAGLEPIGGIRTGNVRSDQDRLVYRHVSDYKLTTIIEKLFKYSNNYTANQILLAISAKVHGPPADIEKGVHVLTEYCKTHLSIEDIQLAEGSGISRENRVSAGMLVKILDAFAPYYTLMPHTERIYFKTGTLDGIQTRVGYIESKKKGLYRFVILLNAKGKRVAPILSEISQLVP